MSIPQEVIETFNKNLNDINYGKVTLKVFRRGKNEYYEIKKSTTFLNDESSKQKIDKKIQLN